MQASRAQAVLNRGLIAGVVAESETLGYCPFDGTSIDFISERDGFLDNRSDRRADYHATIINGVIGTASVAGRKKYRANEHNVNQKRRGRRRVNRGPTPFLDNYSDRRAIIMQP